MKSSSTLKTTFRRTRKASASPAKGETGPLPANTGRRQGDTKRHGRDTKRPRGETNQVGARAASATSGPGIETQQAGQLRQVYEWLLSGYSRHDIAEAAPAKLPGADVDVLIRNALETIEGVASQNPKVVTAWCIEASRLVYSKMMTIADYANAMKAIKLIHDLSRELKTGKPKPTITLDYLAD